MDTAKNVAYIEIDFPTRSKTLVTKLPWSDSEKNCFYNEKPVEVTQEEFERILDSEVKEDRELIKDLVRDLLNKEAMQS